MDVELNRELISGYTSGSQISRVLTEHWAAENMYCPRCGCARLVQFPSNRAVADFYCPECRNEYELKSTKLKFGATARGGKYLPCIQRITSNNNPDWFLVTYDAVEFKINDFWVIPKHFFTPEIVLKRNALSETAQQPGWVGCKIRLKAIPQQVRICVIRNRTPVASNVVLEQMRRLSLLTMDNMNARGWMLDVLNCINQITRETFTLDEMYFFERKLGERHPENRNIRAKIRQQLQLLRDSGFLAFRARGLYKKIHNITS
ncbi:MAG: DpnI domain-containing protein [Planctomycetia bacterium]|nr:DpnI domain-containing protein [Planctomycetia bacterium]